MEQMVVVLHEGALAQYSYSQKDIGVYILWLKMYKGKKSIEPPAMLILHKEGRRWYSDGHPQELVKDLSYAIEEQQ